MQYFPSGMKSNEIIATICNNYKDTIKKIIITCTKKKDNYNDNMQCVPSGLENKTLICKKQIHLFMKIKYRKYLYQQHIMVIHWDYLKAIKLYRQLVLIFRRELKVIKLHQKDTMFLQ